MRKLTVIFAATVAMLFAGSMLWNAEAATWQGAGCISTAAQNFTPIEQAACRGWGRCPPGRHWRCGPYGRCRCVPCW